MSRLSFSSPLLLLGALACTQGEKTSPKEDLCTVIGDVIEADGVEIAYEQQGKCLDDVTGCQAILGAQMDAVFAAVDAAIPFCANNWGEDVDGNEIERDLDLGIAPLIQDEWTRDACNAVAYTALDAALVCYSSAPLEACDPVVGMTHTSAYQACTDHFDLPDRGELSL